MNNNTNNSRIPKLRFPGFTGEWEEKKLGEVATINPRSESLPPKFVYIDLESVESGVLLKRNIIERKNAPSRAQRNLKNGDILFQMVRPYQKNNYLFYKKDDFDYVASTGYAQIRYDCCSEYLYQFLHTDTFVDKVVSKCVGGNYPAINSSDLGDMIVLLPSLPEQQKIASFLSEVDSLIAEQDQKVTALQEKKKGLMQQVFPQTGETVPRLRFPGFEGDWEEKKFVDICNTVVPPLKLQSSDYLSKGKYPIIDQSQSFICGWTNDDAGLISHTPVIIFGDHTCVLKYIDFPFIQGADGVKILSPKEGNNPRFVYQVFLSNPVKQDGYKRHFSDFKEKTYMFPCMPEEQQKIAECLSSLDETITAESDKLEALKTHKKGLMQQLFPEPIK